MNHGSASNHDSVRYAFDHFSKPYLNDLSPGCWTCGKGVWACVFINQSCTRRCFFCMRTQEEPEDFLPYVERDIKFQSVEHFIEYMKSFSFEGVSFSGGEPFLLFDRLVTYVNALRETFENEHYIWVYTNGDPVTDAKLRRLAELNVNEVRFDISARDYDLEPVALAIQHLPTVTVEIPAIPEDTHRVISLLPQLEDMGVKYVNLHQLMANEFNENALLDRGYTVLRDEMYVNWFPVLESELAAREILNYGAARNMGIGLNYCSRIYKHLFQGRGYRRRYAPLCRSTNEDLTQTGYLRRFTTSDGKDLDPSDVDLVDPDAEAIKVVYTLPWIGSLTGEAAGHAYGNHLNEYGACLGKELVADFHLTNLTARLFFHLLFVERHDISDTYEEVASLFKMKSDERETMRGEVEEFYGRFATFEYVDHCLPR